jgi:hypothetical protein
MSEVQRLLLLFVVVSAGTFLFDLLDLLSLLLLLSNDLMGVGHIVEIYCETVN